MKYINVDKLLSEIERRIDNWSIRGKNSPEGQGKDTCVSRVTELSDLLSFIDSLQQEQPECSSNLVDADTVREDFITEVYRVLDADPTNDRANAIINAFDSLPTVSQEQPEVDLEKELDEWMKVGPHTCYPWCTIPDAIKITAEHFYELGLNARKEE